MADWTAVERCRKPPGFGKRHVLTILGFAGFALSYGMRFCLSIAIVSMVNNEGARASFLQVNSTTSSSLSLLEFPHNDTLQRDSVLFKSDICPHDTTPHEVLDLRLNLYHIQTTFIDSKNSLPFEAGSNINNSTKHSIQPTTMTSYNDDHQAKEQSEAVGVDAASEGEFQWNEQMQGIILGSFFYGYVVTQFLGGFVASRIGGKLPFGIGLFITGLGVTVPSMQAILSKWFPPEERGKLGSLTFAGMPFGTFVSTLCSGFLIHYFGWSSVFYVFGILTVIWFILWSCFAHATPFEDPTISRAELHYIQAAIEQHATTKSNKATGGNSDYPQQQPKKVAVPWSRVLLSFPFWAILICNTCETWQLYTINAELPTYMKTVLHFDIKQNSVMSAFPHLLTLIVSLILTNVGDTLIEHKYLSIGVVRKLSTSIAMWGSAAALFGVAYSGCDRVKTVALLATAIGANGGKFGGFLVNIIDIAPNYAGILMGVINTISSMPGFFAPWVCGMIINDNPSLENWRLVFLITAAVSFFGNLVYILCASGEEQSWNRGGDDGHSCGGGVEKTLQSSASSLECININQMIRSNSNNGNKHNNKMECVDNGVYIIPLNPPVEAVELQERHHHQVLLPLPLLAIPNAHHQDEQEQGLVEEKSGLRCSA